MEKIDRHPPASKRCQIFLKATEDGPGELFRCVNTGTHWVKWGGCGCNGEVDVCEGEIYSWECDGPCLPEIREAA
jgi:hypothetical protein